MTIYNERLSIILSSPHCVVVVKEKSEVRMMNLPTAKPVIRRLHQGGSKLLLLRPVR
jgi:hypothetical protein